MAQMSFMAQGVKCASRSAGLTGKFLMRGATPQPILAFQRSPSSIAATTQVTPTSK